VNANASLDSVKPRFAVEEHLRALFATEVEAKPEAADAEPPLPIGEAETLLPEVIREETTPSSQAPVPLTPTSSPTVVAPIQLPTSLEDVRRDDLTTTNEQRHDWIKQVGKPDREVIRGTYRRMADFVVSTTNPDATVMLTKGDGRHLGYHTHYVVDGGKARIIMAVLVTPSEVMENQPMRGSASSVHVFAGNCGCTKPQGTPPTAPSTTSWRLNTSTSTPMFPCLILITARPTTESTSSAMIRSVMSISVPTMPSCHYPKWLIRSARNGIKAMQRPVTPVHSSHSAPKVDHGRLLHRSFEEEYLEQVRAYHTTELYQKAIRKRSVWVEPLFAEGKDWHGMRRFRLRRLWRVNCQSLVRAAGQNLKRLLKKWGWGRRPWPEGAAHAAFSFFFASLCSFLGLSKPPFGLIWALMTESVRVYSPT